MWQAWSTMKIFVWKNESSISSGRVVICREVWISLNTWPRPVILTIHCWQFHKSSCQRISRFSSSLSLPLYPLPWVVVLWVIDRVIQFSSSWLTPPISIIHTIPGSLHKFVTSDPCCDFLVLGGSLMTQKASEACSEKKWLTHFGIFHPMMIWYNNGLFDNHWIGYVIYL